MHRIQLLHKEPKSQPGQHNINHCATKKLCRVKLVAELFKNRIERKTKKKQEAGHVQSQKAKH
ncbi:hypothetical protein SDC9_169957 [bioreactor metagenome]|uniref:Uncharacterized protein n=1 Tax=bioreactor metagenome TaxID=1076179 RepID=A0A645GF14_9ZZZZ